MIEMKAIRICAILTAAVQSVREMLDIREAEYGDEMLYINRVRIIRCGQWSIAVTVRKYWDDYSYPYHKDGDGSNSYESTVTNKVQKKVDARVYNRNQDSFTVKISFAGSITGVNVQERVTV